METRRNSGESKLAPLVRRNIAIEMVTAGMSFLVGGNKVPTGYILSVFEGQMEIAWVGSMTDRDIKQSRIGMVIVKRNTALISYLEGSITNMYTNSEQAARGIRQLLDEIKISIE